MATITVSSSANYATLGHATDDDIVITSAAVLTVNSDPTAINAPRSIRSTSSRASFVVTNTATAFSAGNLWKLSFTNPGAAIGSSTGTLGFTSGATCSIEGNWLECYTATGVASETVLDASNVLGVDIDFPYAIQAESAPGSGVWDWVDVAIVGGVGNGFLCTVSQSNFGTGTLNRILFYDHTTRLLKTGDGTNGTLFASGVKFRIPNIYIHIPPFTMTTAAGWTAATGNQPVVSSTNAPLARYVVGSELVSVNSLPSGTAVNVNTRAVDGTTAAAPAAGVTMYCIPDDAVTALGGKIIGESGGIFRFKKCFFGRWWAPRMRVWAILDFQDMGIILSAIDTFTARPTTITDGLTLVNVMSQCSPARGAHAGWQIQNNPCPLTLTGSRVLSQVSTASTSSVTGSDSGWTLQGNTQIVSLGNMTARALGITSLQNVGGRSLLIFNSNIFQQSSISGFRVTGGCLTLRAMGKLTVSGIRYSATNGAATTNTSEIAIRTSDQGGLVSSVVVRDYDVEDGGVAPYQAWFNVGSGTQNNIVHNQVGGVSGSRGNLRTIASQSRTAQLINAANGGGITVAAVNLSGMRSSGTPINQYFHRGIARNIRLSSTVAAQFGAAAITLDFPPINPANLGFSYDQPSIYAYPDTYPPTTGVLRSGPYAREIERDLYDISGTGVFYDVGNQRFGIEAISDVVLIKSSVPVTGISGFPGAGSVTYTGTSATSGITYEFRLCNWGADITAVSWGSLTLANVKSAFDALTGYTSENGLNIQFRATATTAVVGRNLQRIDMPCTMNASHNPAVGSVSVTAVGAAVGATAALYGTFYTVGGLIGTGTVGAGGSVTFAAPYDFDDVPISGTLKIRALEAESIDLPVTWVGDGANVPAPMAALTGYTAGPYPDASFNKATKVVTVSAAMTTAQLWSAWREYIVQLANFDVDDDWTYPALNAGTWLVAFSGAGSVSGSYTDRDGTRAPITAPNLPTGTRVQFYDVTGAAELLNTSLASPGASTSLYFTTTKTIRLRASKLGSLPIEAFGVITASGLTFIDEFADDDVYIAKGIDGSTVTEFSADEPNVQIDSNDPDGTSSVWRCYAWFRYYETSSIGVAGVLFGAATAVDTENLAIDSARADIQLDNVSGVPLKISDGYMYRTDGATIIAPTSGSIQMDPKKAYAAPAADLLLAELETGYDVGRALRIIAAAVAGKTSGGPTGFVARNLSDTADQIAGTSDASGNRSSATYGA
jgi:hypothetical protein